MEKGWSSGLLGHRVCLAIKCACARMRCYRQKVLNVHALIEGIWPCSRDDDDD
jgi:hypothetical protein